MSYKNSNKHLYLHSIKYFFAFITVNVFVSICLGQTSDTIIPQSPADSIVQNPASKAIEAKVVYQSQDSIVFDMLSQRVKTFGNSKVQYESIDLSSDFIELYISKSEIFAKGLPDSAGTGIQGNPVYKDASETFDADSMKYNFKSKQGLAFGIYTKQEDGYLHGGRTKIHANKEIHVQHGKYTTCDAKCPHFYIELTKGKVIPNDKILFGPAWLVVDEIPIPLVIPFGYFPISKGRSNGIIIPTIGEERSKGFYFRNMGLYFGLGDFVDVKLTGDVYTLGSWRSNLSSNYVKRYKFSGNVDVGYSSLVLDEIRQNPTFNVKWSHSQDAKSMNNASFSANVNYGSVGYARQNTYNTDEFLNNSVSSSVYYSKKITGTPLNFSTSLYHQQNNRDSTVYLTLPQFNLSASSITPFRRKKMVGKERFYERITVSYTGNYQNKLSGAKMDSSFYTKQTWDAFQSGVSHSIPVSTSFSVLKHLHVSPNFNYTERWYTEKLVRTWDDTKPVYSNSDTTYGGIVESQIQEFNRVYNYSYGISCNTKLYGMYQFQSPYIKAIRHIISPSMSFNMSPDFSNPKYNYYSTYQKNTAGDIASYSYFEKGIYGIPGSQKQSSLSFSINNNIEAKVRDANDTVTGYSKIKLIESLSVTGSYNFAADSLGMSLIQVGGYTTIAKRIRVNYSSTFDPYALGVKQQNTTKQVVRTNTYMLDKYGSLWRKTDESWRSGISYAFGPLQQGEKPKRTGEYAYWDVPWNLNVGYNISVPRKYYYNYNNELDSVSNKIQQDLSLSGKFSLSKKWNITFATGWDFEEKALSYTSVDVYRDLHCWHMKFNWIPLGDRQRWEFVIRVNADMLKDLKYEMKSQTNYF